MIWIAFPGKQTMRQEKRNASADSGDSWMKVLKWRGKELGVLILSAGILQSGLAILRAAVFSYRLEKSDVYGIFLYGSSFLGGSSCEAADDRENTVSGPSFLK